MQLIICPMYTNFLKKLGLSEPKYISGRVSGTIWQIFVGAQAPVMSRSLRLSSAQSVVLNYSCYCDLRTWTGLGGRNFCSVHRFSLGFWLSERGVTNASPRCEVNSLKMGYPLSITTLRKASNQRKKNIALVEWNTYIPLTKIITQALMYPSIEALHL